MGDVIEIASSTLNFHICRISTKLLHQFLRPLRHIL